MKITLSILLLVLSLASNAQMSMEKSLKKLSLSEENAVRSKERVELYPRGFIYSDAEKDSIYYLSCIGSDRKDVRMYFENRKSVDSFSPGFIIQRGFEDFMDTFSVENLEQKSSTLYRKDGKPAVDPEAKFVLIYYWSNEVLDRDFIKNFSYFRKYAAEHPELKIQVIPVLSED